MNPLDINTLIKEKFGEKVVTRAAYPEIKPVAAPHRPKPLVRSAQVFREEIEIRPEALRDVIQFCKEDPRLSFDLLHCISGVDYKAGDPLGVTWTLSSIKHKHWVSINTRLPRNAPNIPSIVDLYPAADWHERETYDLVGIIFEGHPNLKRILCADDWEGHPLRKDYVFPQYYHGIPTAKEVRWNS
jgi:NADH-quinone oxidoreductase subunit C